MIKRLLTALVISLATAAPAHAMNEVERHQELWRDLESVGVTVDINPYDCLEGYDGSYESKRRVVTICQDNMGRIGVMVPWTDNDFDTLRHEAHHVVQDCADGRAYDGYLVPLMSRNTLPEFVAGALPEPQIESIVKRYRSFDSNDHEVVLELEAFAVAEVVYADVIGDKVREVCRF